MSIASATPAIVRMQTLTNDAREMARIRCEHEPYAPVERVHFVRAAQETPLITLGIGGSVTPSPFLLKYAALDSITLAIRGIFNQSTACCFPCGAQAFVIETSASVALLTRPQP